MPQNLLYLVMFVSSEYLISHEDLSLRFPFLAHSSIFLLYSKSLSLKSNWLAQEEIQGIYFVIEHHIVL